MCAVEEWACEKGLSKMKVEQTGDGGKVVGGVVGCTRG